MNLYKIHEPQMRGKNWFFSWSRNNLLNETISSYIIFLQTSWLHFSYDWKYSFKIISYISYIYIHIWYNYMYYICNLGNPQQCFPWQFEYFICQPVVVNCFLFSISSSSFSVICFINLRRVRKKRSKLWLKDTKEEEILTKGINNNSMKS